MDSVLEKIAHKLNAYDEASLADLWTKYSLQVQQFEPSKRWEEAVLALCLIQAVQWKNRLFNYNYLHQSKEPPALEPLEPPLPSFLSQYQQDPSEPSEDSARPRKATVLKFPQAPSEKI